MQHQDEDLQSKNSRSSLSASEEALLKELAAAYSLFRTFSRLGKWFLVSVMVMAIALSQLLDALVKIWHYVKDFFARMN